MTFPFYLFNMIVHGALDKTLYLPTMVFIGGSGRMAHTHARTHTHTHTHVHTHVHSYTHSNIEHTETYQTTYKQIETYTVYKQHNVHVHTITHRWQNQL